jgi:hypothetical protein
MCAACRGSLMSFRGDGRRLAHSQSMTQGAHANLSCFGIAPFERRHSHTNSHFVPGGHLCQESWVGTAAPKVQNLEGRRVGSKTPYFRSQNFRWRRDGLGAKIGARPRSRSAVINGIPRQDKTKPRSRSSVNNSNWTTPSAAIQNVKRSHVLTHSRCRSPCFGSTRPFPERSGI